MSTIHPSALRHLSKRKEIRWSSRRIDANRRRLWRSSEKKKVYLTTDTCCLYLAPNRHFSQQFMTGFSLFRLLRLLVFIPPVCRGLEPRTKSANCDALAGKILANGPAHNYGKCAPFLRTVACYCLHY